MSTPQTPLLDKHRAAGAHLAQEALWQMPLRYRGALEEVHEIRTRAGIFDVTHTGRIRVRGDGALDLMERVCTADVARQEDDTAVATPLCNAAGGIMDLCHLLRLEDSWLVLTSPDNRHKILDHLESLAEGHGAKVDDQTEKTVMLSIAGPRAAGMLDCVLPEKVSAMAPLACKTGSFLVARYIVARISDCGEWGLYVVLPNLFAGQAWRFITERAGENIIAPAGLAARDVMRLEAGLPRYGYELNETIDPFAAGLGDAVALNHNFIGRDALAAIKNTSPARRLGGVVLKPAAAQLGTGQAIIPRQGAVVLRADGSECGAVTSAAYSPTLDKVIALAYLAGDCLAPATALAVDFDDKTCPAETGELPFYRA